MFANLIDKRSLPFAIFAIVCIGLYIYSETKNRHVFDPMTANSGVDSYSAPAPAPAPVPTDSVAMSDSGRNIIPSGYENKAVAAPHELLPNNVNKEWAELNPVGTSNILGGDLLDSKAFMGQVSQFKGIMNYDIRAAPYIEKKPVTWMESTYEADVNRTGIQLTN